MKTKIFGKSKRVFEWAISFWIGVGLMSIINVLKLYTNRDPLVYSWIMFGVSLVFLVICFIFLKLKKK